ncbi:MAG: glycosyl hydrolase family 65 protein [Pseudomonadota bacterium]
MRDWTLDYQGYEPTKEGLREALCALGNGYFVSRAAAPDSRAGNGHYPGTYLAGGYNRAKSEVADRSIENEDLVNLPNWLPLQIAIDDGPWLCPHEVEFLDYRQSLDLNAGILTRQLRLRAASGHVVRWHERRLVSMEDPHMAALEVTLAAEGWLGNLRVKWALDGSVTNSGVTRYQALQNRHLETIERDLIDDSILYLKSRTRQSQLEVALACKLVITGNSPISSTPSLEQDVVSREDVFAFGESGPLRLEKIVAVHTSRDNAISECGLASLQSVRLHEDGFEQLRLEHEQAWAQLWSQCDLRLVVDGDHAQMKLRLHLFHLLQTISPHSSDLDIGTPARGWHGEAYRGHIFWDELFIFPFYNFRMPTLTRALLRYRYRRLPEARRLAKAAGLKGALFPWQSGSDGREESQLVHLNPRSGHWVDDDTWRQRHVSAAIAYNTWQYFEITGDHEFLYMFGAELILEIARFWASLARYDDATGRYHIEGVTGPDEFHTAYPDAPGAGLKDNAYTNILVAWILTRTADMLDELPAERLAHLKARLRLSDEEIASFDEISRKLAVPFISETVIAQFADYQELEDLDWEDYRQRYGDIHRLDRILEAEGKDPNRYKIAKQADVLMLFYVFTAEQLNQILERLGYRYDSNLIGDTIDYYINRTSHGSTLSWVVHAWVLSRRDRKQSWDLFTQALESDIHDVQGGTTPEGIHLGAMAGTVDLVQRCYLGLQPQPHSLEVNPRLPQELVSVETRVRYRGQLLELHANHEQITISSRGASHTAVTVIYRGHVRLLKPNDHCSFRLIEPVQP